VTCWRAASFFEALPTGADVYLLKNVLHDWGDDDALRILRRVRDAVGPWGRLVVAESLVPRHDPTHPAVLADIHMMMLCPGGRERSQQDLIELLGQAGWQIGRVVETSMLVGLLEAQPR
jgi:hypothetical protein